MSARIPTSSFSSSSRVTAADAVNVRGPGAAWWVPDVGRIWCSPAMRPLAASVAVLTAVVLAVTIVPEVPAAAAAEGQNGLPPGEGLFVLGPDAEGAGPLVAEDEIGAVVQSRATGRRVEVLALRDEFSQTFVNPDGTWSTEQAMGPLRYVDEASGEWRDIDLDFAATKDAAGTAVVAPKAHPLGLQLPAPAAVEVPAGAGGSAGATGGPPDLPRVLWTGIN